MVKSKILGTGTLDDGKWKRTEQGKTTRVFSLWYNMLSRTLDNPEYKVSVPWLSFQTFAWDISFVPKFDIKNNIMVCDLKDVNNRIYKPSTISFIPIHLHNLLYKNNNCSVRITKTGKHQVYIKKFGKSIYKGSFDTEVEAINVYNEERRLHILSVAYLCFKEGTISEESLDSLKNRLTRLKQ